MNLRSGVCSLLLILLHYNIQTFNRNRIIVVIVKECIISDNRDAHEHFKCICLTSAFIEAEKQFFGWTVKIRRGKMQNLQCKLRANGKIKFYPSLFKNAWPYCRKVRSCLILKGSPVRSHILQAVL